MAVHPPLELDRQDPYSDANDYKAKCAITERLGDIKLRQWCVEQVRYTRGTTIVSKNLIVDANIIFKYIKGGVQNEEE